MTFEVLGGRKVTGTVSRIIPRADPQARTFPVKVDFPNRGARVVAGMLAHVTLPAARSSVATVVPKDAVIRRGPDEFVFLLGDDGQVKRTPVRSGAGGALMNATVQVAESKIHFSTFKHKKDNVPRKHGMPMGEFAIARALGVSSSQISVKATTTEGLGFVGEGEGMAAQAIALIRK